jgi:hypothetical protein
MPPRGLYSRAAFLAGLVVLLDATPAASASGLVVAVEDEGGWNTEY